MTETGFIKLHRKLLNWEWLENSNVLSIFVICLLQANYIPKTWRGIEIRKGSFITSYEKLSILSGLSIQQIRTVLNKLKSTHELTIKTTHQYSIISINNWESYQDTNTPSNTPLNMQPNTQITTTKNIKKIRNKENNILTDFEQFYSLYPRKESKEKAKSAFKKVLDNGTKIEELINGLNRYIKNIKDTNKERKYIKQPATWLNGGCWCDEYESEVSAAVDEWDSSKFYTED